MIKINGIFVKKKEEMKTLFILIAVAVCLIFAKDTLFAIRCLLIAIENKKNGVTKYNYLRWEFPNNDIEGEIEDEIIVNSVFISSTVLWVLSAIFQSPWMLILYAVFAFAVFVICAGADKRLSERYGDFYELFKEKKNREDFSDDLVLYGSRIEGTLTKYTKCKVMVFMFAALGICFLLV